MPEQRWPVAVLGALVVAAGLYLPGIGERVIFIGDEARYALLARNMLESGDWLVPRIGREIHLEKSPLFVWAIAALSLAGGKVTELTAVLPAALSAIAGVGATAVLARRLFGPRAALCAAFALVTTWGYYWYARMALADMMVTFFAVAAGAAFANVVVSGHSRLLPLATCWACLGLGLAAKGPIALMPVLAFAAFLVSEHGWRGLGKLRWGLGVAILASITAVWAVPYLWSGESYVRSVLLEDYAAPRIQGWRSPNELVFALGVIGVGFLPWTAFLPVAVARGVRRSQDPATRRAFRFLLLWVLIYVVVITALPHKRDRYLLATYPALAIMVGWLWDRWAARAPAPGLRPHAAIWAAIAALLAALVVFPPRVRPEVSVLLPTTGLGTVVVVGLLVASGALALAGARHGRAMTTFAAIVVPMVLLVAYESRVYVREHNRLFDIKGFTRRLEARAEPGDRLVTYHDQHLAIAFYAGRAVSQARGPDELGPLLAGGRPVYVVADERSWRILPGETAGLWRIVDRAPLGARQVVVAVPALPAAAR